MGTVTVGAVSANTYGSVAGGDDYFALRLSSTGWTGATADNKGIALVTATRWMDSVGLVDAAGTALAPVADDAGIPANVQTGAYELALYLIANPTAVDSLTQGESNVARVKGGTAEVEFHRFVEGTVFPPAALRLLAPFLAATTGAASSLWGVRFGANAQSSFVDAEYPGFSEGLP